MSGLFVMMIFASFDTSFYDGVKSMIFYKMCILEGVVGMCCMMFDVCFVCIEVFVLLCFVVFVWCLFNLLVVFVSSALVFGSSFGSSFARCSEDVIVCLMFCLSVLIWCLICFIDVELLLLVIWFCYCDWMCLMRFLNFLMDISSSVRGELEWIKFCENVGVCWLLFFCVCLLM